MSRAKSKQIKKKRHRASANTPFAALETIDEKIQASLIRGLAPKTDAQGVVFAWITAKWVEGNEHLTAEQKSRYQQFAENGTSNFVRRARVEWKPKLLRELAAEMTKAKKTVLKKYWEPDIMRWFLCEASKQGPVDVKELYRHVSAYSMVVAPLRTWQRTAKKLNIPTVKVAIGCPKKKLAI